MDGQTLSCELCGEAPGNRAGWRTHLAGVVDYITEEKFDLLCCERCGLVVTQPMPDDLNKYYPDRYRVDRQKQTGSWRVKRRAEVLEKQFPHGFRGRLLDLGCGTGAFALEMQRRGWVVAVTELNDAVLDELRAGGMEAKRPDEALREGFRRPFDAITAWHVLEHVPRPLELASWARTLLNPAGVFQATVPNLDSYQAQMSGRHWLHLDVPRHLYHFTPATLAALIDNAGMRIESSTTFALEYDVFGQMQSVLNGLCGKPNVLFERLTARDGKAPAASRRDVLLSYGLAPFLGVEAGIECGIAWAQGKGATLTVTCRTKTAEKQPH